MLIAGRWLLCDDDVERPVVEGEIAASDGSWCRVPLLVDTGADRTVLSADTVHVLGLQPAGAAVSLEGVGGMAAAFLVVTDLRLLLNDGGSAVIHGTFTAVNDPAALDMSVLGRDVTNHFALIVDRPDNVVCLLGQLHRYTIASS